MAVFWHFSFFFLLFFLIFFYAISSFLIMIETQKRRFLFKTTGLLGILNKKRENCLLYLFRVLNFAKIRGGNRKTTVWETPIIIFITRLLKTKENKLNNHSFDFEFNRSIGLNYTKHWKLHFITTFSTFRVTFAYQYIKIAIL